MNKLAALLRIMVFSFALAGCNNPRILSKSANANTSDGYSIRVSWTANKERAVNQTGGGYRVYYSTTSGFNIATASFVDVPYVSGSAAPTSTSIRGLRTGTYFIKVVAYSSIVQPSSPSGSTSSASSQITVVVN